MFAHVPPVKESRTAGRRLGDDVQGPEDSAVSRVTQHDAFICQPHSSSQTFTHDGQGSSVSRQSNTAPVVLRGGASASSASLRVFKLRD